ncbi:RNA-binding domain-containing protein [Meira miltonrushii]|uniref:RNA-binding domain-containing protein n=1 Tax=Meira miltonrushii TaxID=1280837 RepID=A0A316VLF8_9BASI|nr:RNA-binding domain-containing protein [Meira miltonrushii]PWN36375.1 RNA-binding domain-containing protein [Meira miltonrushii]
MSTSPKRLHVTRFPLGISARDLGNVFESIGPIFECRIPFRARYAFVEYLDPEDALTAMTKLNGYLMEDKQLTVSWATQRSNNNSINNHIRAQKDNPNLCPLPEKPNSRYAMPNSGADEESIQENSKVVPSQQSPKAPLSGWESGENAEGGTGIRIRGISESGEAYQNSHCGWDSGSDQEFDFTPDDSPVKTISRPRSEGDVRMLNSQEKHLMKNSESAPCLSKRKRSFGAVGGHGNTEAPKRAHAEEGW